MESISLACSLSAVLSPPSADSGVSAADDVVAVVAARGVGVAVADAAANAVGVFIVVAAAAAA